MVPVLATPLIFLDFACGATKSKHFKCEAIVRPFKSRCGIELMLWMTGEN
jgi:hypothetical protein